LLEVSKCLARQTAPRFNQMTVVASDILGFSLGFWGCGLGLGLERHGLGLGGCGLVNISVVMFAWNNHLHTYTLNIRVFLRFLSV